MPDLPKLLRLSPEVRVLTAHFFRAFFHMPGSGDASETTVVRAFAGVATPMLMAAFWVVTLTHNPKPWTAAGLHYLFVLYSFAPWAVSRRCNGSGCSQNGSTS